MITTNFLIARFNITFNHKTFDQFMEFRIDQTAMKNFFGNTYLLFVLFVGVGVISVNYYCRILQIFFLIFFPEKSKIFVMIIRDSFSVFIDSTSENGMSQRVSCCFYFPASVYKSM